ncbi:bifunctional diguanylate cyclase/phosphodiesterase [Massilia sp. MS-15]|uniref:putative bifunctional diguanylate cyclase/phosphodiesterase n=1 Tax=Massilia sp. MS-15 TaxID=2878200 RepID=UPI001CD489EB|nr:GGDEF and EAL domain-containing protein [Massilia sp. MS-15]MCA1248348.1 EAL domain-containing protein [Massilia sp. MS-15]
MGFHLDKNLIDKVPAGIVIHDSQSAVIAANAMAQRLLGEDLPDIRGRPADHPGWSFVAPDGSAIDVDDLPASRVLREKLPVTDVVVGVRRPGAHIIWLICNAYPVFDSGGQIASAVVCFTDCSELVATQQALEHSQQRLQLVLRALNEGYWDWDLDQQTLFYSERWWDMLGYAPGTHPTDIEAWQRLLHPEDRERVNRFLAELLAGAEVSYAIEFRLWHRDGHAVPVLSRGFVLREATGRAVRISGANTDLTERKQLERQLQLSADHDYLTGLPNRRYLLRELERRRMRAVADGQASAVLLIDLDNFKLLNDTEGHPFGDRLLQEVGRRLLGALERGDFVGRLGGDEFVVLLDCGAHTEVSCAVLAQQRARDLCHLLGRPFPIGERHFSITPSIGAVLVERGEGSADLLLQQADIALYAAKSAGRNAIRFFDPAMQRMIDERARLQDELAHAVERGEFVLYYQPQFDAEQKIVGAEALLRWQHPLRGLLAPGSFIPLAETSDLIVRLGDIVLRQASERLAAWSRVPALARLGIAVNVSARQMHDEDFVARSLGIMRVAGADPSRLSMELTESLLATDIEATIEKMHSLRREGIRFSVDDFGTGFSSLSYIQRFPLSSLKIDQSFVATCVDNPRSAGIVEIVIGLADRLGLGHIAEGVETAAQLEQLKALGCRAFQGYLLGVPMPVEEFEAMALARG